MKARVKSVKALLKENKRHHGLQVHHIECADKDMEIVEGKKHDNGKVYRVVVLDGKHHQSFDPWMFVSLPKNLPGPRIIKFKNTINSRTVGTITPAGDLIMGCVTVRAVDIDLIHAASMKARKV